MGPAALRTAGLAQELFKLGHQVVDLGDAQPKTVGDLSGPDKLYHLPQVAGWTRSLQHHAAVMTRDGTVPIFMGGDHALSLGTVTGHAATAHAAGRRLFVLWIDAHADFNTFDTTESGNLHGTPLAYACGLPGFDGLMYGPASATVLATDVCILGLRSVDHDERALVESHGIDVQDMRRIDELGVARALGPFLDRVAAANGLLHVSLDVDFADPDIAPAVGTTVPGGATFREAHLAMEMLCDSGLVSALDIVELNPFLDDRGRTARLMVDLAASLFGRRIMDRPTRSY
jgi:arginase